ncbi:MAG: hypothetical protein LBH32_12075 [Dysgonamonadaceae bacterium]|jgi:hypothetical protein|nr:hypothetical protein [Dysgonamonadaceae bacterium]
MRSFELFSLQQSTFAQTVNDRFGQSILETVFQPLGSELQALIALDEEIQRVFAELAMRSEEAALLQ